MIGYGSHPVPEEFWSYDTSMEIALIDSFNTKSKFDYDDIMIKFNNLVKDVSSLTHRHEVSILGCYIYINYVLFLLNGKDKFSAYNMVKLIDYSMFSNESLDLYSRILKDDINKLNINDIKSSGYVIDTLEASLWWVLLKFKNYKAPPILIDKTGGLEL